MGVNYAQVHFLLITLSRYLGSSKNQSIFLAGKIIDKIKRLAQLKQIHIGDQVHNKEVIIRPATS